MATTQEDEVLHPIDYEIIDQQEPDRFIDLLGADAFFMGNLNGKMPVMRHRIIFEKWLKARDEKLENELLDFAKDVINQYGYEISEGIYTTGGLSTQEWAFSILRRHNLLDKKGHYVINTLAKPPKQN